MKKGFIKVISCMMIVILALSSAPLGLAQSASAAEVAFDFTQTHTVSFYAMRNALYVKQYLAGFASPMDGTNGTPDYCIPGLQKGEEMIPQGIAYYKEKGWMLISAYSNDDDQPSVIYALDENTGEFAAQFNIYKTEDKIYTGHAGGIAVSNNNLYITNSKSISFIPLSEFDVAPGTAKNVVIRGSRNLGDQNNNAGLAYVTITDGVLYTGNFYYSGSSSYDTPASDTHNSIILSFSISGTSSESEWENFLKTESVTYYVPNSISKIQSASIKDGNLYMVTSYGRRNVSTLYVAAVSPEKPISDVISVQGMPMMESMVFRNGYMYTLTESAAYYYYGKDKTNIAKDPTDVIWKLDYNALLKENGILSALSPKDNSRVTVDEEFKTTTVPADTSVNELKPLYINEELRVLDINGNELSNEKNVGTGCKVQVIGNSGEVLSEYTVIVGMDVDGDGSVTAADARLALRASVGLDTLEGVFSAAANCDGDEIITAADARMILRRAVGLE